MSVAFYLSDQKHLINSRTKPKILFKIMAAQNICIFNKFGFCKFSENCRKKHNNEKCSKSSCDVSTCQLRHPKVCRYLRDYKYCKFGEWCKFHHVEAENNSKDIIQVKKEQEILAQKLNLVEKQLEEKNKIIETIQEKFEYFDLLKEEITAKDNLIKELDDKINKMEEKISVLEKNMKEDNTSALTVKTSSATNVISAHTQSRV